MLAATISWLLAYRYLVLFPIAVLEGPIITIIAGSLAANGQINFWAAYAIIIAGDVTGDSLYYAMGRFGRKQFIARWGHYVGLTPERLQKIDRHYLHHAGKTLVLGKLAFSFEIPFIVSAGLARFSYLRFLFYMICGALPKSLGLLLVGYFFGYSLTSAQHDLSFAAHLSAGLIIAAIIVVGTRWLMRRYPVTATAPSKAPRAAERSRARKIS